MHDDVGVNVCYEPQLPDLHEWVRSDVSSKELILKKKYAINVYKFISLERQECLSYTRGGFMK